MQYVLAGLGIATALGALISAISIAGWKAVRKENVDLKQKLFESDAILKKAQAVSDGEIGRRERIIAELKAEVTNLENDLAANRDPAAVRARLGKLLSNP